MQLRFFLLALNVNRIVFYIGKTEDDKWRYDLVKTRTGISKGFEAIDIETPLFLKEIKYAL